MTKSKGIGRGGRRKGAGRPRFAKIGKTSYFSTRLTQKTRDLLEAEARRSGKTLSGTAGRLLKRALEQAAERRRPGSLRSLFFVMEILLRRVVGVSRDRSWRSSPYLYAAFRAGVIGLFDLLRPAGEIVAPPPKTRSYPESPEEYGRQRLRDVLDDMIARDTRIPEEKLLFRGQEVELTFGEDEDPREYYGLGNAMGDLGLPIRGRQK